MRLKKAVGAAAICTILGFAGLNPALAQKEPPASDNTKVNQRDRVKSEPTADQAKNNLSDREIMQKIRKALIDDKALSTYAHNVKIIAQNGKVTLKGPVRSAEEKETVEKTAKDVAGGENVTSELTVKAARAKKTS